MTLPVLQTERLMIRPFAPDDLDAVCALWDDTNDSARDARRRWLDWTIAGYEQYATLYQPPYGERAVCLSGGQFTGSVGYVPCLDAFGQFAFAQTSSALGKVTTEFGLFWSVLPAFQNRGYATEAARALVDHAFTHLRLARIVATTEYDNLPSQAVMRKLGMQIERNPLSTPPWLQIVGILEP